MTTEPRTNRHTAAATILIQHWITTTYRYTGDYVKLTEQFVEEQTVTAVLNLGKILAYPFTPVDVPRSVTDFHEHLRDCLIDVSEVTNAGETIADVEPLTVWEVKQDFTKHLAMLVRVTLHNGRVRYDWQCDCGDEAPQYFDDVDSPRLFSSFTSHLDLE